MKKSLIAMAAVAVSGIALAQSSATLYGIADAAIVKETAASARMDSGGYSTSRWGIKGSEDLGGGVSANFLFESRIDITNGASSGFGRQAYVGFSGGFGEVKLGKVWSAYDDIAGSSNPVLDANALTPATIFAGYQLYNSNPNQGVYYATPSLGGVSGAISSSFKDTDADNLRSTAFHVKYEGGPVFAGLAYQVDKSDVAEIKFTKLNGSYDLGAAKVLAGFGNVKATADSESAKEVALGVDVPLGSSLTFSTGVTQIKQGDAKDTGLGFGVFYALSKRTTVYSGAVSIDTEEDEDRLNRFALGIKHTF